MEHLVRSLAYIVLCKLKETIFNIILYMLQDTEVQNFSPLRVLNRSPENHYRLRSMGFTNMKKTLIIEHTVSSPQEDINVEDVDVNRFGYVASSLH